MDPVSLFVILLFVCVISVGRGCLDLDRDAEAISVTSSSSLVSLAPGLCSFVLDPVIVFLILPLICLSLRWPRSSGWRCWCCSTTRRCFPSSVRRCWWVFASSLWWSVLDPVGVLLISPLICAFIRLRRSSGRRCRCWSATWRWSPSSIRGLLVSCASSMRWYIVDPGLPCPYFWLIFPVAVFGCRVFVGCGGVVRVGFSACCWFGVVDDFSSWVAVGCLSCLLSLFCYFRYRLRPGVNFSWEVGVRVGGWIVPGICLWLKKLLSPWFGSLFSLGKFVSFYFFYLEFMYLEFLDWICVPCSYVLLLESIFLSLVLFNFRFTLVELLFSLLQLMFSIICEFYYSVQVQ